MNLYLVKTSDGSKSPFYVTAGSIFDAVRYGAWITEKPAHTLQVSEMKITDLAAMLGTS